jgi:hypothetical protein
VRKVMKNLLTQSYRIEWRAQVDGIEKEGLPKKMDQKPKESHPLGRDSKTCGSQF